MPTVTFDKKIVMKQLGKKVSDEVLKDRISMLGTDLEKVDDKEIVVEIFPNRPDMLSEEGFARALSSFMGIRTGLKKYRSEKSGEKVIVEKSVKNVRPYTAVAIVKGIEFDEDKIKQVIQLQEKLHVTFGRHRKKAAIGIYPYEKIKPPIRFIARKPEDIVFRPLEYPKEISGKEILEYHSAGKEYAHLLEGLDKYPVFIDSDNRILSMPPIINSHDVGKLTESTKDVFIECSGFDFGTLKKCLTIIVCTLADMGGRIYSMDLIYPDRKHVSPDMTPERMKLKLAYVNRLLGMNFSEKELGALLEKMGFGYQKGEILIPSYRTDILHPFDLVEDVAIAYGYENFREEIPQVSTIGQESPKVIFARKAVELMVGLGFLECNSYHLANKKDLLDKMNLGKTDVIRVSNAVNIEYDTLRNSILPDLMKILSENTRHEYPQKLFETGEVFSPGKNTETGIKEEISLAGVIASKDANFTELKANVDAVFRGIGKEYKIKECRHPSFLDGRAVEIFVGTKRAGVMGEVNPKVLENFETEMPVTAFELNLDVLMEKGGEIEETPEEKKEAAKPGKKPETVPGCYYDEPYKKEMDTLVEKIEGTRVILKETIFYPGGGGAPPDRGTINGVKVTDVDVENMKPVHILEKKPAFREGDKVKVALDWNFRHRIMRMHTAAHLVYLVANKLFGQAKATGSNVDYDKSRVDMSLEKLDSEMLKRIEDETNKEIKNNRKVRFWWDEKRKGFRWSEIESLGKIPCGGVHIESTKEIGKVGLKRKNLGKDNKRIEIVLV